MAKDYGGQVAKINSNGILFLLKAIMYCALAFVLWYLVPNRKIISAGNTAVDPGLINRVAWAVIAALVLFAVLQMAQMLRYKVHIYEHGMLIQKMLNATYISYDNILRLDWETAALRVGFIPIGRGKSCRIIGHQQNTLSKLSAARFSRLAKKMAEVETRVDALRKAAKEAPVEPTEPDLLEIDMMSLGVQSAAPEVSVRADPAPQAEPTPTLPDPPVPDDTPAETGNAADEAPGDQKQ